MYCLDMSTHHRFLRRSRFSVSSVAKPLVALALLAGSTAVGVAPASAATAIDWNPNTPERYEVEECISALGKGLSVVSVMGSTDNGFTYTVEPTASYSSTPTSVTIDVTFSALILNASNSSGAPVIRFYPVDDCETPATVVNTMSCFSLVSSSVDLSSGAYRDFGGGGSDDGGTFDVGDIAPVGQDDPNQHIFLILSLYYAPIPTTDVTLKIVLGKTESDCSGGNGGEEDGGATTGPWFDFSLDPYAERAAAGGLPDTL